MMKNEEKKRAALAKGASRALLSPAKELGSLDTLRRFQAKFLRGGEDECWLWLASTTGRMKHGCFFFSGKNITASRFALMHKLGRILNQHEYACHKCDVPRCVNPAHLYLGNVKQNACDVVERRRHWRHDATHCKNGHTYTPDTTRNLVKRGVMGRVCRTCQQIAGRARLARKHELRRMAELQENSDHTASPSANSPPTPKTPIAMPSAIDSCGASRSDHSPGTSSPPISSEAA